jgi:hypothetical protein
VKVKTGHVPRCQSLTILTKAETESELWCARPWAYESAKKSDRGAEVKVKKRRTKIVQCPRSFSHWVPSHRQLSTIRVAVVPKRARVRPRRTVRGRERGRRQIAQRRMCIAGSGCEGGKRLRLVLGISPNGSSATGIAAPSAPHLAAGAQPVCLQSSRHENHR